MMRNFSNLNIQEIPLSSPYFHREVECFLSGNGLRPESLDSYYAFRSEDGSLLAGAGIQGDVIKCVAVSPEARSEGLTAPLISHIISQQGGKNLKVFTKPENRAIFESLGFRELASAPAAVLMENGRGLEQYCAYLRSFAGPGRTGVVVMNANPFTLGHQYLLQKAMEQVDRLIVIPVREDVSAFSYRERLEMIRAGAPEGVTVVEGSAYQISALTFPTYFLKDLSDAAQTQMALDVDLFARHIAPALGAAVRFVGTEPSDSLTACYNTVLKQRLDVVEIPRLSIGGTPVSASAVRAALDGGHYAPAAALVPPSSRPCLGAFLAVRALTLELDTPLKPGLVGPDSRGAHPDMDYALMKRSIAALRPWFVKMASARSALELQQTGLEAEKAMLEATGGVNTHKGAIYCLGLALYACGTETAVTEEVMKNRLGDIAQAISNNKLKQSELYSTHGSAAVEQFGVKGARAMAEEGYLPLWEKWLPCYRCTRSLQKTLLAIMSTLDDTCVLHRVGYDRAQQVKREAGELLEHFSEQALSHLCEQYTAEGISPGGAADMLSLTILLTSIII